MANTTDITIPDNVFYIIIAVIALIAIIFILIQWRRVRESQSQVKYLEKQADHKKIEIIEKDLDQKLLVENLIGLPESQQEHLAQIRNDTAKILRKVGFLQTELNQRISRLKIRNEYMQLQKLLEEIEKKEKEIEKSEKKSKIEKKSEKKSKKNEKEIEKKSEKKSEGDTLLASLKRFFVEKRWGITAIVIGFLVGFLSAYLCIIWHLVIFGFNIMYIVSPLMAGVVETFIARRKYGKSTGAISALLTFLLINIYGWFLPGYYVDPTKEPATLSLFTLIAILLTLDAAFPTLMRYILFVVVVGTLARIIGFLVTLPSKIQRKPSEAEVKEEITGPSAFDSFLDELPISIVSVPNVEGGEIKKYLGLVSGDSIAEEKESKGRLSKISNIIQPTQLGDMNLDEARKGAISRMLDEAKSLGANTVIEVLIYYVSMGGLQGSALIVTATGTAVIYE
jgi:uncharacterized protein YbjQ (UPF0145 family)